MSVSVRMQAFQEMGEGRKPSKNSALQLFILYAVKEGERNKTNKSIATFFRTEQAALPLREHEKFFRFWHNLSTKLPGAQQHKQL